MVMADALGDHDGRRIVVGVDGSPGSLNALRWASDEARLRGDSVTAVLAWTPAPMTASAGLPPRIPDVVPDTSARDLLLSTVTAALGHDDALDVEQLVEHGPAGKVLVDLSDDADLIVLGAPRHGGLSGLRGVSAHVTQHSHCPVVTLPST